MLFRSVTSVADMPPYEASMANKAVFQGTNFPTSGANAAAAERGSDVRDVHRAYYYDVITGKIDLDSTWDGYLNDLNAAGLQDIIAGYQAMFE